MSLRMATLGENLQTWKLKLSTTKNGVGSLPSQRQEAKRELKVNFNKENLL